jgi:hypothetical protein
MSDEEGGDDDSDNSLNIDYENNNKRIKLESNTTNFKL